MDKPAVIAADAATAAKWRRKLAAEGEDKTVVIHPEMALQGFRFSSVTITGPTYNYISTFHHKAREFFESVQERLAKDGHIILLPLG